MTRELSLAVANLQPHPLSVRIFGHLSAAEFRDLVEDIRVRGLQHKLELDAGHRVICGGERLRAVQSLEWTVVNVKVHDHLVDDNDIIEHLVLDNLIRRHLKPSQQYRAGKELERVESVRAQERRLAGKAAPAGEAGTAAGKAAGKVGVSSATYRRLKTIYEHGSAEVQDQVDSGTVSVSKGASMVRKLRAGERRTGQVVRLEGDDSRTLMLRWAKLQFEGKRFLDFLQAHKIDEFGAHQQDAVEYLNDLARKLLAYTEEAA